MTFFRIAAGIGAAAILVAPGAFAATLANPDFDADSYLEFGTNQAFDPLLTVGESQRPGSGHFNWGVITFDTSSLGASGSKFLSLSAVEYKTLTPNPAGPPTTTTSLTGNATLQIVALGDSYSSYLAAADKLAWYDANVQSASVPVLGTMSFTDQSTRYIDVTSTVNGWISTPAGNHGFAVFSTSGNVELGSMTHGTGKWRPALVDAAPVPEPSSAALLGLGGLALAMRRRRQ